jgi:aquaporin Z
MMIQRLSSEFVGTFALVFAGGLAIATDVETGGTVGHLGIAVTFGLVIMAMIYAVGDVSGAHFNPAVSLAFLGLGRMKASDCGLYIIIQTLAAVVAAFLLGLAFEGAALALTTVPAPIPGDQGYIQGGAVGRAFLLEVVLTFFLIFVILGITSGIKERGNFGGIAIGGTVLLCALAGGPISGASMNPARSLGPALVAGELRHIWIYLVAPVLGAALAIGAMLLTRHGESRPAQKG